MPLPTIFVFAVLGLANMVLGIALLIVSNLRYYRRTGDNCFRWLWIEREKMTPQELLLNRLGVAMTLVGLVVSWSIVAWSHYTRAADFLRTTPWP